MRGRKPKPTYLRVLDGNAGRRPQNQDEPAPAGALDELAPPDHLTEAQKRIWRDALKNAPPGLLRKLDWAVFEQWVVHHANFLDAAAKVSSTGQLIKKGDGWDWNPYMSIMNKQSALALKCAAELGFTPSSRTRVKVEKPKPGKGSAFADLKDLSVD
jgi:P27 family predicted phage terminase small subunit